MPLIRHEPATGPASRALFEEYMSLVRARLGAGFAPSEDIFATEDAFAGAGAAWLVMYDDDRPVACGGMRRLESDVAEVKRMFVTAHARGRGYGRALLAELERLAAQAGYTRVRLYTTEVLTEARALYDAAGYRPVDVPAVDGRTDDVWLEKSLPRSATL